MSFSSSPWTAGRDGIVALRRRRSARRRGARGARTRTSPRTSWMFSGGGLQRRRARQVEQLADEPVHPLRLPGDHLRVLPRRALGLAGQELGRALQPGERVLDLVGQAGGQRLEVEHAARSERGRRRTSTAPTQAAPSRRGVASTASGPSVAGAPGRSIDWLSCESRVRSASAASGAPPGSARTGRSDRLDRGDAPEELLGGRVEVQRPHRRRPPPAPASAEGVDRRPRDRRRERRRLAGAGHGRLPRPTGPRPRARRCGCG